jgi:hypothetical protein
VTAVVIVGDVMDDISARHDIPLRHGTDTAARIALCPGGGAANQAAWLGHLGVPVLLVARLGAADVPRHTAALAAHGADVHLAADPDRETGRVVLLVDGAGERTMLTDPGANAALAPATRCCATDLATRGCARWSSRGQPGSRSRWTRRRPGCWPTRARSGCCRTPPARGCSCPPPRRPPP